MDFVLIAISFNAFSDNTPTILKHNLDENSLKVISIMATPPTEYGIKKGELYLQMAICTSEILAKGTLIITALTFLINRKQFIMDRLSKIRNKVAAKFTI